MRRFIVLLAFFSAVLQCGAVKVGVLLPFKSRAKATILEFYRGFLMAVDSVKHEGVSVEVYTFDSGTSKEDMVNILNQGALENADVIFGPGSAAQTDTLATYCKRHGIRMVIPFSTPCEQIDENEAVHQVTQRQELLYPDVAQIVMENFADAHFVMLKSDSADVKGEALQSAFNEKLSRYGLSSKVLQMNAGDEALDASLSISRNNFVVLDNSSEQTLESAIALFNRFRESYPFYRISVLGFTDWLKYAEKHEDDFYAMDTYVCTPFYNNPYSGRSIRFGQKFQSNFKQEMGKVTPSMAMTGFDLGYYFLTGVNPRPLQQDYDFRKVSASGGSVNHFVELVHYGTNKLIDVVR